MLVPVPVDGMNCPSCLPLLRGAAFIVDLSRIGPMENDFVLLTPFVGGMTNIHPHKLLLSPRTAIATQNQPPPVESWFAKSVIFGTKEHVCDLVKDVASLWNRLG
jgi:hypothetical protein